jgi:uncharacterized Zn finger protein (UPF0148 family)
MATTETIMTATTCPLCGSALRHRVESLRCIECEVDFELERQRD